MGEGWLLLREIEDEGEETRIYIQGTFSLGDKGGDPSPVPGNSQTGVERCDSSCYVQSP